MSLKQFLYFVGGATLLAWVAWGVVLFQVDPDVAGRAGLAVFYGALLVALIGTFTLIGLGVRKGLNNVRKQPTIAFKYIAQTIRQAFWFALVVIVSLMLSAAHLFTWWSSGILLISFIILESFFLTHDITTERPRVAPSDSE